MGGHSALHGRNYRGSSTMQRSSQPVGSQWLDDRRTRRWREHGRARVCKPDGAGRLWRTQDHTQGIPVLAPRHQHAGVGVLAPVLEHGREFEHGSGGGVDLLFPAGITGAWQ